MLSGASHAMLSRSACVIKGSTACASGWRANSASAKVASNSDALSAPTLPNASLSAV